jgi:hypothetical protein
MILNDRRFEDHGDTVLSEISLCDRNLVPNDRLAKSVCLSVKPT